MKRKLFFLLCALLTSVGMLAQDASPVGAGTFFLYNVGGEKYLTGANNWGTRASLDDHGLDCTLSVTGGNYHIATGNGFYLGSDGYVDKGSADKAAWTFTAVQGQTNVYTIKTSNKYLVYDGSGTTCSMSETAPTTPAGYWKLFTKSALQTAAISGASIASPSDVTFLVDGANFVRNCDGYASNPGAKTDQKYGPWTVTISRNNFTIGGPQATDAYNTGCEMYDNAFDLRQTITVPKGIFYITCDGFDASSNSRLYGKISDLYGNNIEASFTKNSAGGKDFKGVLNAISVFREGAKTDKFIVKSTSLTVGVRRTISGGWTVVDNIRLYYCGFDADFYQTTLTTEREFASELLSTADMNKGVKDDLQEAYTSTASVASTQDALEEALNTIEEAITTAQASVSVYESISALISTYADRATKLDSEGQAAYDPSTAQTKYDNGTYVTLAEAKADLDAAFAIAAAAQTTTDWTALITNPNFSEDGGWEGDPTIGSGCAEKFNCTFDVYQVLAGMPAGLYKLQARAYDRQTDDVNTFAKSTALKQAILYAGGAKVLVKGIFDDAADESRSVKEKSKEGKYMPDDMAAATNYFNAGLYENEVLVYHLGGDLRIGIKKDAKNNNDWCCFDNFRLTYLGTDPIANATDMTQYIANPSFESGTTTYWTPGNGTFTASSGSELSEKDGNYLAKSDVTKRSTTISQLSGALPAGTYLLQMRGKTHKHNNATGLTSQSVKLGSSTVPVYFEEEVSYSVAYTAAKGDQPTISFGGQFTGGDGYGYFYCDNFKLTYYTTLPDVDVPTELTTQGNLQEFVRTSLVTAKSNYDGNKTAANYNALQTAIYNAKVSKATYDATKAVTTPGSDWTALIYNSTFDSNTDGWTPEVNKGDGNGIVQTEGGVESWNTNSFDFYQTIYGIPDGIYTVTLDAYYRAGNGGAAATTQNAKLYAVSTTTTSDVMNINGYTALISEPSGHGTWSLINSSFYVPNNTIAGNYAFNTLGVYNNSITVSVTGGSLQIGIKKDTRIANDWTYWDNFKLIYVGSSLPKSLTKVEGKMSATAAMAQTNAVDNYNASEGQTIANYNVALAAIDAAELSKTNYATITSAYNTCNTKAEAKLTEDGQEAFNACEAVTNYNDGAYEDNQVSKAVSDIQDAYVYHLKTYPANGADMTELIDNPSFEGTGSGGTSGWTTSPVGFFWTHSGGWAAGQVGKHFAERWENNTAIGNGSMTQTLTDMPVGMYVLTANAQNIEQGNGDAHGTGFYLTVGDQQTEVGSAIATTARFISSSTGNLTIGVKTDKCTGNWVCVDNFQLIYYSGTSVTLDADGCYSTFACDYPLDFTIANMPDGVRAYKATVADGGVVSFSKLDRTVPAKTGVLLVSTEEQKGKTVEFKYVANGGSEVADNEFKAGTGAVLGTYDENYYFFALKSSDPLAFGKYNPTVVAIPKYRAYLQVERGIFSNPVNARLVFSFDENDNFTGINSVEIVETEGGVLKDGKYIIDNKIVIVKNGVKYGANGQKLN